MMKPPEEFSMGTMPSAEGVPWRKSKISVTLERSLTETPGNLWLVKRCEKLPSGPKQATVAGSGELACGSEVMGTDMLPFDEAVVKRAAEPRKPVGADIILW
jgi:hypothetical protein